MRRRYLNGWLDWRETPAETPLTGLMADHLWQGDQLIDAVVSAFRRIGAGVGRRMLNQALDHGIDSVEDPPAELVALFDQLDNPPDWYDPDRWERGRLRWVDSSLAGKTSMVLQDFMGTFVGEEVSTATGGTGRFISDFRRREHETVKFFYGVTRPGANHRFSPEFKDVVRVRLMHGQARAGLRRSFGDDHFGHHGNPISNSTMAGAAMTFGLLPLLYDHAQGRRCSVEELDLAAHYWGYIAYIFGVADELIPRCAQDALVMIDYMVGYAGGPTPYTDEFAQTAVATLEGLPGPGRILARAATSPVLGVMAHFAGRDLVHALVRSTLDDQVSLQPWTMATAAIAGANVRARAISDRLPLRPIRRRLRATAGDPALGVVTFATGRHAGRGARTATMFTHHDKTPDTPLNSPISSAPEPSQR